MAGSTPGQYVETPPERRAYFEARGARPVQRGPQRRNDSDGPVNVSVYSSVDEMIRASKSWSPEKVRRALADLRHDLLMRELGIK